mmetsp:Transcript_3357/g.14693  ORF Transcript_3357/g.14693 Transcript_3357/m.14693 type:complete len:329 (-) Transcript_3357:52-1038(-)
MWRKTVFGTSLTQCHLTLNRPSARGKPFGDIAADPPGAWNRRGPPPPPPPLRRCASLGGVGSRRSTGPIISATPQKCPLQFTEKNRTTRGVSARSFEGARSGAASASEASRGPAGEGESDPSLSRETSLESGARTSVSSPSSSTALTMNARSRSSMPHDSSRVFGKSPGDFPSAPASNPRNAASSRAFPACVLDHQPYLRLLCTSSSPCDFMTKNLTSRSLGSIPGSRRPASPAPSKEEAGGISSGSPDLRASAAAVRQSASRKLGLAAADDARAEEVEGLPPATAELGGLAAKAPPPLDEPALLLALLLPRVGYSSAHLLLVRAAYV